MNPEPKGHPAPIHAKKAPRRLERIFAFKVLYGLCFHPAGTEETLRKRFHEAPDRPEGMREPEGFAWELVHGVWSEQNALDASIASYSQNWRVERMGKVEITLLRIAVYELTHRSDIPPKVAINEALDLSKLFGDDKSRAFINGILDAAARASAGGEEKNGPGGARERNRT
jgi:N utilization substance protein B